MCSDFPLQIIQLLGIPHFWKPPKKNPPKSVGRSTQVVHLELGCAEGCSWSIPGEERSGTLEAPGKIYPLDTRSSKGIICSAILKNHGPKMGIPGVWMISIAAFVFTTF